MQIYGSWVALITPFHQNHHIDYSALDRLLALHLQKQSNGLILAGTTGENTTLDEKELMHLSSYAKEFLQDRLPLVVGAGCASTQKTCQRLEGLAKLGVQAALVVTPYYNKPSQKGLLQHFRELAKVGLPLIIYHNPSRSGVYLQKETIIKLSEEQAIIAIKESSGNMELVQELVQQTSLPILAGEDRLYLSYLANGAVGSVNVTGNVFPKEWKEIQLLFDQGKPKQALKNFLRLSSFMEAIFQAGNPMGIKSALHELGWCENIFRPPLCLPSEEQKEAIAKSLEALALVGL